MKKMRTSAITGFAALAMAVTATGCMKDGNNKPGNGPQALMSVEASLGNHAQQAVTRAISNDPTLTPAEGRVDAGHVMKVTLGGLTENYTWGPGGLFVPVTDPIYFPDTNAATVDFWLGINDLGIGDQDGTAERLLAADRLVASGSFDVSTSLSGITLTHANSLVEIAFDAGVDTDEFEYIYVNLVPVYNNPETDRYLAVIKPGLDRFSIMLYYKGMPYELIVSEKAIGGNTQEFKANYRYSLLLDVDEIGLSLQLLAISVARWSDGGAVGASVATMLQLNGDDYKSVDISVTFTDGTSEVIRTDGNGLGVLQFAGSGDRRVIRSVSRISGPDILIGRTEGGIIALNLTGDDVRFRAPNSGGSIPVGSYAELALINSGAANLGGDYLQEADIDLLGSSTYSIRQNWAPVGAWIDGVDDQPFTGTYDGNGFNILNLYIDLGAADYAGLFGYCRNATLRNVCIASGTVGGRNIVGGVCGYNGVYDSGTATVSGCANLATVTGTGDSVGGVCGYNDASGGSATISESYSAAAVTGSTNVGGICGQNAGDITNCFWGAGSSADTSPAAAVGNGVGDDTCYQFGDTYWPGINPVIAGFWETVPLGRWNSLGAWSGLPETSVYPTIKHN